MDKTIKEYIKEYLDSADEYSLAGFITLNLRILASDTKESNINIILDWIEGKTMFSPSIEDKRLLLLVFSMDNLRVCDECGEITNKGFKINDSYACSRSCAISIYEKHGRDKTTFEKDLESEIGKQSMNTYQFEW